MARQEVDIGIEGNDATGDSIRESFKKVNENFTELYAVFGLGGTISFKNIDDTPDTYLGNENSITAVNSVGTNISYYKLVSDSGTNNDSVASPTDTTNSVFFEFTDPIDPTQDSGTLKVTIVDPHIDRDPDPVINNPLNAQAPLAYNTSINNILRNVSGSGDDVDTLATDWNNTHTGASSITSANIVISKGYADDTYVNATGDDTLTGFLEYDTTDAGFEATFPASGNQIPRADDVVQKAGDTMTGLLNLSDHPAPLAGQGNLSGDDDLQAATKLYVDSQGFSSTTNLYVSTDGDDSQALTPAGKEGRGPTYAYRTIGAAMRQAERIVESTPYEPGPYVQAITYGNYEANSYVLNSTDGGYQDPGVLAPVSTSDFAAGIIDTNKESIKNQVTDYIDTTFPDLIYNDSICRRDIDLILESIKLDVQAGLTANYLTRWAGLRYNANPSAIIAKTVQYDATRAGIQKAQELVGVLMTAAVVDTDVTSQVADAYSDRFDDLLEYIDQDLSNDNPLVNGNGFRFEIFNGANSAVDQGIEANPDLRAGRLIVGKTSGAKGVVTAYERAFTADSDRITVELLEPIVFQQGEELEFGALTRNNHITVRVESGIYNEHLPIKLPENVSIKGDEFRRVVVRPKAGVSQSPWANTYFYRDIDIDNLVAVESPITSVTNIGAANISRTAGTYTIVANDYATTSLGQDATFSITVAVGGAATITITDGGKGFIVGETITISDSDLGAGGAPDLTFDVETVGGGYHFTHPVSGKQGKYGYHYITDSSKPANVGTNASDNPAQQIGAARLVELNKAFITEEVIAWINDNIATDTAAGNGSIWDGFSYTESKCRRDTRLIIDGIVNDLRVGGREATLTNQAAYYSGAVSGQEDQTVAAISYIKTVAANVLANDSGAPYTKTTGNTEDQTFDADITAESGSDTNFDNLVDCIVFAFDASYNAPKNNNDSIDVFLCNDATIVRNISVQRHDGFMMVLDPEGQILTKSPYCQTGSSFSQSKGTVRTLAGGLFADGYAGNMPAQITSVNSPYSLSLVSPADQGLFIRRPPTPFPIWIDGSRYQVNALANYNQTTGTCDIMLDETSNDSNGFVGIVKRVSGATQANPVVVTTSAKHRYNDGALVAFAGVGGMTELNGNSYYVKVLSPTTFELYSDDALTAGVNGTGFGAFSITDPLGTATATTGYNVFIQSGGNRSMLSNDFTQVNDLGFGAIVLNNALSELVSMFTYYCHTGYLAKDGSQIRSIAGNNSYGTYGLVAEGSDPDEIATDVTLNADMVFPAKVFRGSHVLTFPSSVGGTITIGETISQEITGATGVVSFFLNDRKTVYLHTVEGTFNTSDQIFGDDSATLIGVASDFDNIDASAATGALFVYAYDLPGLPNNVSEAEILHDSGLYQPYEITNATQTNVILDSHFVDNVAISPSGGTYSGSGATFTITKDRTNGYGVILVAGGTGYNAGETIVVPGADLGADGSGGDATVTIDTVDSGTGAITAFTGATGTPAYDTETPVLNGQVWRFNLGTGLEGTSENGLQEETNHDTICVVRHKQNFVLDGLPEDDLPVRPSTAFIFDDDYDQFTYRTIGFTGTITDGFETVDTQRVVTFDSNFRYLDLTTYQDYLSVAENTVSNTGTPSLVNPILTVDPNYTDIITNATPTSATLGNTVGDRFIAINTLDDIAIGRIAEGEMIFSWGGKVHSIDAYAEYEYNDGSGAIPLAVIQISDFADDINYPTTADGIAISLTNSRGITLKGGLQAGETANITVNISTCRATGHDMLDIGVGGYRTANYPERIFGAPSGTSVVSTNDAIDSEGNRSAAQVQERDKGRVFTVMTDQDGFFRVGRFFTVDQGTGSVTFNAALVLTNIDGIGFKRGVRVNEFSNDDTFSDAKGDAVPTQTAVEGYINARLGFDRNGALYSGTIGPGVMSLGGPGFTETAMNGDMNLGGNRITNLATPSANDDAATKLYVDQKTDQLNDIGDVTLEANPSAGDLLIFTGSAQASENAGVIGDIVFSRTSANELTTAINTGVIVNADVNASAAIDQSKLNLSDATAAATAGAATKGIASFDSSNFETDGSGWVGIKDGGVSATDLAATLDLSGKSVTLATGEIGNTELANSSITIGSTAVSLGGTITALTGITTINHTGNITGPANSGADNGVAIGSSGNTYNAIWATTFHGTATEALYADLAENYLGDADYEPGTVVVFGGDAEVTVCSAKGQTTVAGVVTTNPAHLMNSHLKGDHVVGIALQGRVPCKVIGKVNKGDMLVTSAVPGYAIVNNSPGIGQVIGKAVGTKDNDDRGIVEVVVGRV
jgi:hypothetical protein